MIHIDWKAGCEIQCERFGYLDNAPLSDCLHSCVGDALFDLGKEWVRHAQEKRLALEITGYNRSKVAPSECAFLDNLLEHLAEEYSDPDGFAENIPKHGMRILRGLEQAFIEELLKHYTPLTREAVALIKVPVSDWLSAHHCTREELFL